MAKSAFRRKYQRLLTKSYYALVLAVRRVTQDRTTRARKLLDIDGIKNLPPMQRLNLVNLLNTRYLKASPTRRVWIPKPGRDEKRPLGIPTMYDRALQSPCEVRYGTRMGSTGMNLITIVFSGGQHMMS